MAPPRKVTDEEIRAALLASDTYDEAAAKLGVGRSTVTRYIRRAASELRKPKSHPRVTDDQLRAALRAAPSLAAAGRALGLVGEYIYVRTRALPDAAALTAHMPKGRGHGREHGNRSRRSRGSAPSADVRALVDRLGSQAAAASALGVTRQRISQILKESIPMTTMTLSTLDPLTVGEAAARALVEHLTRAAFRLSPGVTFDLRPTDPAALRSTDLALTAAALTTYAQRGLAAGAVWDWTGDEDAADALNEVCSVLATPAVGDRGTIPDLLLGHADGADDPVRLVLTAAWARVCLSRGDAVTAPQLGALAGLSASRVRALRGAGEIPGWEPGTGRGAEGCPATVARRWLGARGVAGV